MTEHVTLMADIPALAKSGQTAHLLAKPKEMKDLAKRIEVLEVKKFVADMTISTDGPGIFQVKGALSAEIVQACVRTLKPIDVSIQETFSLKFMAEEFFAEFLEGEEEGTYEDVEVLGTEDINLGEIAVQYLSLAINPYPVSDGALPEKAGGEGVTIKTEAEHQEASSPFAVLKKLDKKG